MILVVGGLFFHDFLSLFYAHLAKFLEALNLKNKKESKSFEFSQVGFEFRCLIEISNTPPVKIASASLRYWMEGLSGNDVCKGFAAAMSDPFESIDVSKR